ncbi:putative disulfide formation protein [Lentibacillus sp. JNUCC-1]|uniref:disulfide oxidoreductase n=1 Tax=Lentibacillus sp. JNUCC-1 TaxID=2654513 RepID=UPI0012E8FFB2|nr:disulfide oxidoreductase [Lentibacillus sp. JNUCC-1]MUV36582.1 putative disulfide formation protein [Lentibacillus sp. JNUCC-1]
MAKQDTILLAIWVQALIASAGSLFYSEAVGFVPCELCWVQRIFMYPLVVIYGVSAWKKDIRFAPSGLILSVLGLMVSVFHYLTQKIPFFQAAGDACGTVSCSGTYVNYLGFITIPFMAGIAFIVIIIGHILLIRGFKEDISYEK